MLRHLVWTLALAASCRSAPVAPIPDPLPETLEWASASSGRGGAFLGLEGRENDSGSLSALSFEPGLRITAVAEGSPARAAGFQVGDVLLEWDGVRVDDPEALATLLAEADPASRPTLLARRGDSAFTVPVELRAAGEVEGTGAELAWRRDPARSRAGWLSGRGGAVLVSSDDDGPFPAAGIPVGSVVLAVDDVAVRSARACIRALQALPPGARVAIRYEPPSGDEVQVADVELFAPRTRITEASLPVLAGYRSSPDGETRSAYLLDLYFLALFRYARDGAEREVRILRFIRFSTGKGELTEGGS